jgi:hypothetical protein
MTAYQFLFNASQKFASHVQNSLHRLSPCLTTTLKGEFSPFMGEEI